MGIETSPYVQTIRVIMAELQRIASHCIAVGTYGMDIGAFTPFLHLLRDREKILDLFEWTCGARLLYNYNWIGGLSHDVPDGFVRACRQFLREFDAVTYPELMDLLIGNKIFIKRTADIGVCSPELAISYDLTGPNLRGSGVKDDLRKDEPYCGYEQYEFEAPVGKGPVRTARLLLRPQLGARDRDAREREDPAPGGRPAREDGARRRPREGAEAREAGQGRGLRPLRGAARPARLLHRRGRDRGEPRTA
jgi:NADH:ubiquinone oxidoreductase subunit D